MAREARQFYQVSALQIDLLPMIFMGVFLIACIPASFIINKYGIRIDVGIGAVLAGLFGLFKGVFAANYTFVIVAQIGLAVGQPFIINAATKVASNWFSIGERATAVGIATLAQFLGIIGVMIATPISTNIFLLISSFVLGFFLLGAGAPIGFQYSAEITYPAPESSSQGLLLFVAQISGILFIVGMNSLGMIFSLMILIAFALINIALSFLIKESDMI